jgi:hypothetical protein
MKLRSLILIVALAVCVGGCTASQVEDAKSVRDRANEAIAQIDAEIAKLAEGDPVRVAYEKQRAKLEQARKIADGLLASVETGQLDPSLITAAGVIPVVGPYAGLIALLGGLVYKSVKEARARKALTQVVKSVDEAFPTKTTEQTLKLSAVQDESTRKMVDAAKKA